MKIRWNDLVYHKNYKEYIILFYNSEINKKINKDEYKVIDFLSKNNIDVSLENSDYLDLFSNDEDAKYIYNYIKIFINQGILKVYESINKKIEEKNKITTLCIILTNKCNLRCRHCCQDAGYTKYVEYSKSDWEKVIDLLFSYFDFDNIMISGGEPLIVDYMFDIVSYIERKKKSMKFTLMTNGLLIDKNNIKLLKKYFNHISISLDGIDSYTTKIIRKEDLFIKILDKLYFLKNEGFLDISVSAVLPKSDQIENAFELLCKELDVFPMIRDLSLTGRCGSNISFIDKKYKKYIKDNGFNEYFDYEREDLNNLRRCGAGKEIITITPDGSIFPCNILQNESFKIGNVKDENIYEKITKYNIRNRMKENLDIKCNNCEYIDLCWSCYSKCLSYADNEKLLHDRCTFRKERMKKCMERIY